MGFKQGANELTDSQLSFLLILDFLFYIEVFVRTVLSIKYSLIDSLPIFAAQK